MPNIRVMNWNIEQLSQNKLNVAGMPEAIARTVVGANVDLLIVLEVKVTNVAAAMTVLSNALNAAAGGGNAWHGYFLSQLTTEYYCIFIRDLNRIRPMYPAGRGPGALPVTNLKAYTFEVWPSPNFAVSAYPLALGPPEIPLVDLYASARFPRPGKKAGFGGQPLADGGYSLGRGFRLPAMGMFWIHTATPSDTIVPVVMCHYAAVRNDLTRNILAQTQISQQSALHIPQFFRDAAGQSDWLEYRNVAGAIAFENIAEIVSTGDYNCDFQRNRTGGTFLEFMNHKAYDQLTPTMQQGGSAAPAAAAAPAKPMPAGPYAPPFPAPPTLFEMPAQALRAAVTAQGTILLDYPLPAPPPASPYGSAAFDNFIYGGTRLSTAAAAFGPGGIDSGEVIDVPASIVQTGGVPAAGQIDLATVAAHYAATNTKNAHNAPNLQGAAGVAPPLTADDRLIGARLVSDHLPVVLQFAVP